MNIDDFKKLLSEGKQEEAQELLEQFLASAVSPREQGQAILSMASAHMEAQNSINEEYVKVLKNFANELSALKKEEGDLSDAISLAKARKQLE